MASIAKRINQDGTGVYFVRVRRKGYPTQTATFTRHSDAKKWAQVTEAAVLEGRHFPSATAKRHTVADVIDRYVSEVPKGSCCVNQLALFRISGKELIERTFDTILRFYL